LGHETLLVTHYSSPNVSIGFYPTPVSLALTRFSTLENKKILVTPALLDDIDTYE